MRYACIGVIACALISPVWAQNPSAPSGPDIINRITGSSVLILSGEGAGRLSSTCSGVIVRPDGVILTAYHAIKDAREVQVRLKSGEVFDQAVLIGVDERRDVAAIKITARNLPALPVSPDDHPTAGETVYVVSGSSGLGWSASKGVLAASRLADEIPGAGQGYRVLQFTAPVAPGASGGPLVDAKGNLIGVITKGMAAGAAFAVPIDSVIGLADGTLNAALGSGYELRLPTSQPSPSSAAVAAVNPQKTLRSAKTIVILSKTTFFTPASLEKDLMGEKGFPALGLTVVKDARVADLYVTIDRPLFTYYFTYTVTDAKTSVVLEDGKVTAFDGSIAAGKIAKQFVRKLTKDRKAGAASASTKGAAKQAQTSAH